MRRKLVKQGPSTLTVSLPANWVHANKLQPGGNIDLLVQNNQIVISAEQAVHPGSAVTIDVRKHTPRFIGVLLSALHKKGCDEVRLVARKEQFAQIEARVKGSLLGFEIVSHEKDIVTIRFVTKVDRDELPALVRHAFFVTISIAEAVMNGARHEEVVVLEETNNRITNYCERIINRHSNQEENVTFRYLIIWLLEKLADEYRDISKRGEKVEKEDGAICIEFIRRLYNLNYKYSLEQHDLFINDLSRNIEEFMKKHSTLLPVLLVLQQTSGSLIAMQVEGLADQR